MDNLINVLSDLFAVSGNEDAVRSFIINYARDYSSEIKTDAIRNIYVFRKGYGDNKKNVMLCAHMDEVGLIISSFTPNGYLKFRVVGGIDTSVLLARRVFIGRKKVKGVIGIKAVHLTDKDERDKKPCVEDMYIDIGAESAEEAMSLVNLGDYVSFDTTCGKFGNLLKGKAFDDRIGCFILCELLKKQYYDDVTYCFTVQEETGLRGASVAAYNLSADLCYVIEATVCLDLPEVTAEKSVTQIGYGPAISISDKVTYADKMLNGLFANSCTKFQYKKSGSGGNDAGSIHLNGIRTASVSIPSRYIHSPVSVVSPDDIDVCIKAFDRLLSKGVDFND
ncbi:MAG: M42 family peptidase [Clostridia bacterium]|nr:M42 family peptidase [Clostridia bacterium]